MISFMEKSTSFKMVDQNDDFITKENCNSLSVMDERNAGNSYGNLM